MQLNVIGPITHGGWPWLDIPCSHGDGPDTAICDHNSFITVRQNQNNMRTNLLVYSSRRNQGAWQRVIRPAREQDYFTGDLVQVGYCSPKQVCFINSSMKRQTAKYLDGLSLDIVQIFLSSMAGIYSNWHMGGCVVDVPAIVALTY